MSRIETRCPERRGQGGWKGRPRAAERRLEWLSGEPVHRLRTRPCAARLRACMLMETVMECTASAQGAPLDW